MMDAYYYSGNIAACIAGYGFHPNPHVVALSHRSSAHCMADAFVTIAEPVTIAADIIAIVSPPQVCICNYNCFQFKTGIVVYLLEHAVFCTSHHCINIWRQSCQDNDNGDVLNKK
jgi:hypothetical protein